MLTSSDRTCFTSTHPLPVGGPPTSSRSPSACLLSRGERWSASREAEGGGGGGGGGGRGRGSKLGFTYLGSKLGKKTLRGSTLGSKLGKKR